MSLKAKLEAIIYAAETLITDGKNEARARCGNQVSDTPRQPTLARQAPLASLDETERVLSATASAVAGQSAPLLAQEIFPAPAPLQMALGG